MLPIVGTPPSAGADGDWLPLEGPAGLPGAIHPLDPPWPPTSAGGQREVPHGTVIVPLLHAIFEVLLRPAEENDQSAALEKQMLRRSYFAFLQTVTGSGMSEVIANQGGTSNALWLSHPHIIHTDRQCRAILP